MAFDEENVQFNCYVMDSQVVFREILHRSHSAEQHNDYKW